jgi:hypothetical protein
MRVVGMLIIGMLVGGCARQRLELEAEPPVTSVWVGDQPAPVEPPPATGARLTNGCHAHADPERTADHYRAPERVGSSRPRPPLVWPGAVQLPGTSRNRPRLPAWPR